jgi:DHA1 family tetracycline resistance protein-like MFS transporter
MPAENEQGAANGKKLPRRAAFAFIFVTVMLDMLGIGIVIPVLPGLVTDFVSGDTAFAAQVYGVFGTAFALMQFLFSPVQGALSDRFGRRPVILLSNLGVGLDYVLMAIAPNLIWLFVGRVVSGVAAASVSTGFAYVADVTPPAQRAARFGMLGAGFGVGFVLGPAVGGVSGAIDPRLPFWIAAVFSLLNALYGVLVLPESLPKDKRAAFSLRRANPLGALNLLRSQNELAGLATVIFLANLAHAVLPSVGVLYMTYRYGWDEQAVGLTLAGIGVCAIVVQGGLVRLVVARFGERVALIAGSLFGVAGFFALGLAETGWAFLLGVPLLALWGLANPATQGLMSRRLGPSEQGRLQGANSSIQGIANLFGPGIFTLVFAAFIGSGAPAHVPGAPFVLAGLMVLAGTIVAWRATEGEQATLFEIGEGGVGRTLD